MQLPHVQPRNVMQLLIRNERPALVETIVHDGDARLECGKDCRIGDVGTAMVRHQVRVDWPEQVLDRKSVV